MTVFKHYKTSSAVDFVHNAVGSSAFDLKNHAAVGRTWPFLGAAGGELLARRKSSTSRLEPS